MAFENSINAESLQDAGDSSKRNTEENKAAREKREKEGTAKGKCKLFLFLFSFSSSIELAAEQPLLDRTL
jgi:hypothetical protein